MTERSLAIDLLRVISIALVVLSHYELLGGFILSGTHGVAIFFMVSGYCMYYSTQNRDGAEFLKARFWRLIPTLVICATITSSIEWILPYIRPDRLHSFKGYFGSVFCLPAGNMICDSIWSVIAQKPLNYAWVDGAYWSLLIEIRFYLLLWLIYYIFKIKRISVILSLLGLLASLNISIPLISKSQDFLLYLSFFAFGISYRSFINHDRYSLAILLLSFFTFVSNSYFGSKGISMTLNTENFISYAICFIIFTVIMTLFKNTTNSYISYLGLLSYPLYLIHQDVGLILIAILEKHLDHLSSALLTIAMVLLISIAIQKFISKNTAKIKLLASQYFTMFSGCFSKASR